jgi:hypothetical protein
VTLDQFWDHIRLSTRKDPDAHAERLEQRLIKLKAEEIIDFIHWWDTMVREAYDWNLWGAAYLINGGCSDDGFHYFCTWLVMQGRDVFQAALTNPDTLADVVDPDEGGAEWGGSPGADAWFKATRRRPNDAGYTALAAAELARHGAPPGMPDLGDGWDHDDDEQMKKRFPRLSALYTEGDGAE